MSFHAECYGKNITLSDDGTVASRENPVKAAYLPFGQGTTFTSTPIDADSTIIVEVLAKDHTFAGTLCMGLTNHDPTSFKRLPTSTVPDFGNKPGNWCTSLEDPVEVGDWVAFKLSEDGSSVSVVINGCISRNYQLGGKIDSSKPWWGIVDVYGSVTKVRLYCVKASDVAAVEAIASDTKVKKILDDILFSAEGFRPFEVNLHIIGEDNTTVSFIRKSLLRQQEGEQERDDTNALMTLAHFRDWQPRKKDIELDRRVTTRYAECVADRLKKADTHADEQKEHLSSSDGGISLGTAHENQIQQRVKFSLLKKQKEVTSQLPVDNPPEKPSLTILEFSTGCLERSLHEMFILSPIRSPMMVLYVIDYDKVNIDQDKPEQLKFLSQFHAALRMVFTRVCSSTGDHNEHHKQYLSPPVILVGMYEESDKASAKIEQMRKLAGLMLLPASVTTSFNQNILKQFLKALLSHPDIGLIESLIRGSLDEKVYHPHVISLYHAIPHHGTQMDPKSNKMIENLRKHISRTAQGELETDVTLPLWWALLRKHLLKMKADGKPFLSSKEIASICSETEISVPEMTNALHHLNESGDVLLAANEDGPFVFLEPIKTMELVSKATTVVDPAERWSTHNRMWAKMAKEGILSETLLNHIWKDNMENKDILLGLMTYHHLLYDATNPGEKTREFLIPSLLPEVANSDLPSGSISGGDVRVYVDFSGNLPGNIFIELGLSLRSWAIENDHSVTKITRNLCEFNIDSIDFVISLCCFDQSVIQVDIKAQETAEGGIGSKSPEGEMAIMIRDEIKNHLDRLAKASRYRDFTPIFCAKCMTCCDSLIALDDCLRKSSVSCTNGQKLQTNQIRGWFQQTDASSNEKANSQGEKILLTDKLLTEISGKLGQEWKALGRILDLTKEEIYQIQEDNKLSVREQMFQMLAKWSREFKGSEREKVEKLCAALDDDTVDQGMLADDIKEKLNI